MIILQDPPVLTCPLLHHWPDVAYLLWLTTSIFSASEEPIATPMPAPIRSIFRLSIQNMDTISMLNTIMAMHDRTTYNVWPGATFDIESKGKGIIGTPNGATTAWLLMYGKAQLGRKKIGKLTVFDAEHEGDLQRWQSLLFG
jgi:hypothetical protein